MQMGSARFFVGACVLCRMGETHPLPISKKAIRRPPLNLERLRILIHAPRPLEIDLCLQMIHFYNLERNFTR